MTIEAFVLAGGKSRRFGSDKARAIINGKTLIEHNVAELRTRYERVRVVSAPGRSYDDLGLPTLWDLVEDLGPLAGIHTALSLADTDLIVVAPCDVVGLDATWYELLESACGTRAAAFKDERWHPLVGAYHKALLPEIERRLQAGELAVRDLLEAHGTAVDPPATFGALGGVNTPADAARLRSQRSIVVTRHDESASPDVVAVEEPLEIRLSFEHKNVRVSRNIAITMRTPGHDAELAVGFLFGEGIVRSADDVMSVEHCGTPEQPNHNVLKVTLADDVRPELARLERNFYTTSSCGVCGKSSLEALDVSGYSPVGAAMTLPAKLIHELSGRARRAQEVFSQTGGLHAAALFSCDGELLELREDVGRHNALDKIIGFAVRSGATPLSQRIVFLSGRASFELLQKALAAQVPVVCAVGAPSSLAVDLAERFGITLVGFVRNERFNVYAHPERIVW